MRINNVIDILFVYNFCQSHAFTINVQNVVHLHESYVSGAAIEAGAAAEVAASRKKAKYADLGSRYIFQPTAVETLGVFSSSACLLLNETGKRISVNTGESRETGFLFQRVSVLVQRFNAILLHDSLPVADCTDR